MDPESLFSEKRLALLITILTVVIWVLLLQPLFAPGYLINNEHPLHQGLLVCAHQSPLWSLPTVWCDHLMAGVAPFQVYPVPFYMIVLTLMKIFSLATAYKIGIVLVWLSIPAAAGAALLLLKKPLAASITFSFLLLEHGYRDVSGIESFLVEEAMFNQTVGIAMLIVTLMCLEWYLRSPNKNRFSALCLSTALYFLFHPTTFLFFVFPLCIMIYHHRAEAWKQRYCLMAYPCVAALLASFWLVPFLGNAIRHFFNVDAGGPLPFLVGANTFLVQSMNPLLLVAGIVGLIILARRGDWPLVLVPFLSGIVFLIILGHSLAPNFILFYLMQAHRLFAVLRVSILIGGGFLLSDAITGTYTQKKWCRMAGVVVLAVLIGSLGITSLTRVSQVFSMEILTKRNLESVQATWSTENGGRVLIEELWGETTSWANLTSLWGLSPILIESPGINQVISYPKLPYAGTAGGYLFGKSISSYNRQTLLNVLELLNIKHVIVGSDQYKESFKFLEKTGTISFSLPDSDSHLSMDVYRNNATTLGWFKMGEGNVLEERYARTEVTGIVEAPTLTNVLLKIRYWPNWRVWVDGIELAVQRAPTFEYMYVTIPKGRHTILYRHEMKFFDYFSWILSMIGVGLLILMAFWPDHIDKFIDSGARRHGPPLSKN